MSAEFDSLDITSLNATAILTVAELFPSGFALQGYATDQSISLETLDITETRSGIDGGMVAGVVSNIKTVTIMLEANSPSYVNMAHVFDAMEANSKPYKCTLTVTIPSIGLVCEWSGGVMKSGTTVPALKKVLDPTTWVFHFPKLKRSKQ